MDDGFYFAVFAIFLGAFAFFMGSAIGGHTVTDRIWNEAIQRGYANYCPLNGDRAWIGECDE